MILNAYRLGEPAVRLAGASLSNSWLQCWADLNANRQGYTTEERGTLQVAGMSVERLETRRDAILRGRVSSGDYSNPCYHVILLMLERVPRIALVLNRLCYLRGGSSTTSSDLNDSLTRSEPLSGTSSPVA